MVFTVRCLKIRLQGGQRAVLYLQLNRIYWPQTKTKESIYCKYIGQECCEKNIYPFRCSALRGDRQRCGRIYKYVLHKNRRFWQCCKMQIWSSWLLDNRWSVWAPYWGCPAEWKCWHHNWNPVQSLQFLGQRQHKQIQHRLLLSKPRLYKGMFFDQ